MNFKLMMTKMLPAVGKRVILSEVDNIRDKLDNYSLPAVESVAIEFKKNKFKTEEMQKIESNFARIVRRGNLFEVIKENLQNGLDTLDYLEEQINDKFAEDITRDALTVFTVNVLKLTEVIGFSSEFARRLALYATIVESNELITEEEAKTKITKADQEYINAYLYNFMDSIKVLNLTAKEIKAKLDTAPDINVNADSYDNVKQAIGEAKIDPLKQNFISPRYSPMAFFAIRLAKYQAEKYKQAQADLEEVQSRIIKLRHLNEGKNDPKLDRQIEYYTNINDKLRAEIADMEEAYELK